MAILDAKTWLEVLSPAECWRLLRLTPVARLAVVVDGEPNIWPLNIAVDAVSGTLVFRTDPGSKIAAFQGGPVVCVEADGLDLDTHRGWSVVAAGRIHELAGAELTRARSLPLVPWTVGTKERWFGIEVDRISGRAIGERASRQG